MRKYLVFVLAVTSLSGYGQDAPKEFRFNSMTDHVSFEETQLFGKLNLSIPLYTVSLPNFNLPLEMNYNQDGNVNFNTQGAQFGDAWDFNLTATVSRRTREVKPTSQAVNLTLYTDGMPGTTVSGQIHDYPAIVFDESYYSANTQERPDEERDVFQFNVLGLSGKFFVKRKSSGGLEAKLLESSDYCNINLVVGDLLLITAVEITDKNGYKYVLDVQSNINRNISYKNAYGPAIGSLLSGGVYGYTENSVGVGGGLWSVNPAANNTNNLSNWMLVLAEYKNGTDFWENLNLSKIYDKEGRLLVNISYESFIRSSLDQQYSFVGISSGFIRTDLSVVKEIAVTGKGKITFLNSTSSGRIRLTNSIQVKDLKDNIIDQIDFTYNHVAPLINRQQLSKALLTQVKQHANTSKPQITAMSYKTGVSAPGGIFDIDVLGYITKGYYKYGKLGTTTFAADLNVLQKIKYPTGGSVLYKFGANTSKNIYPAADHLKDNIDNQVFITPNVSHLSYEPGSYSFTVTDNDMVFIIPNSNNATLYKYDNGSYIAVTAFNNSLKYDRTTRESRSLTEYDNVYDWPLKMKLDAGSYKLMTGNTSGAVSGVNANKIVQMNYVTGSNVKNYVNVEGMRIEEIAHFNSDVAQNLLDQGNSTDAEKHTRFDYSGDETNSSSGRVFNDYRVQRPLFSDSHVFYGQIAVQNRGIGTRTNIFTSLPNARPAFKKVVRTSLHDSAGLLLEETTYDRVSQHHTPLQVIPDMNMIVSPYETQVDQTTKTYEGGAYIQTTSQQNYETLYRQLSSSVSEDNLGKTTKSEFDYDIKGSKIVNTQQRSYINNNLTEQLLNTYGSTGDFVKTEFKTPDMSAYEKVGNENNKHIGGLVRGYIQPDGTPVTLVYGYLDNHIIAKMVNVDANLYYDSSSYQTIRTNLDVYSTQWHGSYSEANLKNTLNSLRNTFPNALVTTYTYKPMVGVSSITDENGKTTTYEYDSYNRLAVVKDYLGNILKEYQYNFTN